jgi:uncharacterized protein (TIGR02246 family)
MTTDEQAIRELVETWMAASRSGNVAAILNLMTDDAVFMTAGQEPFGKAAFAAASEDLGDVAMEGTNEIVELKLLGDWAFIRNRIDIIVTPSGGASMRRSGYTLTLLRKEADGQWRLARDANLMVTEG